MTMTRWETFKEKHLGKIGKVVSWLISIASLVFAVLAFFENDFELGWATVLTVIVLNSFLLIIVAIYETLLYGKGSKIVETLKSNHQIALSDQQKQFNEKEKSLAEKAERIEKEKTDILDLSDEYANELRFYFKYIISSLNKFSTELLAVNYNFTDTWKHADELKKYNDGSNIDNNTKIIEHIKNKAIEDYRTSMIVEYDHFLSNILTRLKHMLEVSLRQKNSSLKVSISVKQFSRKVIDPNSVNDVVVKTTFRDSVSYSKREREIREQEYHINRNTDLSHCLSKPYFLKNNIQKDDPSYDNEFVEFYNYFNCEIVVPIICIYPEATHYFGYLTCDILNTDMSKNNLLDQQMAEIMQATANIMGLYLDDMEYQWSYVLKEDFLNIIYERKVIPSTNSEVRI